MSRVKKGVIAIKKRRKILGMAKGYRFGRSKKEKEARTAVLHAGVYAFAHRKDKKNDFRALWQTKIGAAANELGLSYSKLINILKKGKVGLDRKILSIFAEHNPELFKEVVKLAQE